MITKKYFRLTQYALQAFMASIEVDAWDRDFETRSFQIDHVDSNGNDVWELFIARGKERAQLVFYSEGVAIVASLANGYVLTNYDYVSQQNLVAIREHIRDILS